VLVMFLKSMCPRVLSYISYELWFMTTYVGYVVFAE